MNGNSAGSRTRFSMRQLLMGVALIALLLSLISLLRSFKRYVEAGQIYYEITDLTFSPDGTRLAVVVFRMRHAGIPGKGFLSELSHTVALLDTANLEKSSVVQQETQKGIRGRPREFESRHFLGFVQDGKEMDVLTWDGGKVRCWDISTNGWSNKRVVDETDLGGFELSPNGQWIATWSRLKGAAIWDCSSRKKLMTPSTLGWPITFSPDSKNVAFATPTDVQVWDLEGEKLLRAFHENHDVLDQVTCLGLSPDGDTVAVRCNEGLRLFSLATGKEHVILPEDFEIHRTSTGYGTSSSGDQTRGIAFSPDGKLLAAWGTYGLKFFDMTQGCKLLRSIDKRSELPKNTVLVPMPNRITCLAFAPDGKTYATGDYDCTVTIWDTATGTELRSTTLTPALR